MRQTVSALLRWRDGRTEQAELDTATAADWIMGERPPGLAGLTIYGGLDELIRSHVPIGPPAWALRGREYAERN